MTIYRSIAVWMLNVKCFSVTEMPNIYSTYIAVGGCVYRVALGVVSTNIQSAMKMIATQFAEVTRETYLQIYWGTKVIGRYLRLCQSYDWKKNPQKTDRKSTRLNSSHV